MGDDKPTYRCERCDRILDAEVLLERPIIYHPMGGSIVLHRNGELVLCDVCQRSDDSWPWWADFGLAEDEAQVLAARYDDSYPEEIPPRDRAWS